MLVQFNSRRGGIVKLIYHIGNLSENEQIKLDFEDALSRSVEERMELGLFSMKVPVVDDVPYRIFNTIEEYREWQKLLPKYLGYYKTND